MYFIGKDELIKLSTTDRPEACMATDKERERDDGRERERERERKRAVSYTHLTLPTMAVV